MNNLQQKIKEINSNSELTHAEKMKKIQEIYLNNHSIHQKKDIQVQSECTHYTRNNTIFCETCNNFYKCRLCHDNVNDHKIDRFKIDKIKCNKCNFEQAPSKECVYCGIEFGHYYCDVCHLWELDKNIDIYHCDKCGICRKGKREDFIHCDKCDMCLGVDYYKNHTCVTESMKNNCPICNQYMFDSVDGISVLPCGHSIHAECMKTLFKNDYRCPLCKKSVHKMNWSHYDRISNSIQIPDEYKEKKLKILCNDCENYSVIPFTIELYKCYTCGGYNTSIIDNNPDEDISSQLFLGDQNDNLSSDEQSDNLSHDVQIDNLSGDEQSDNLSQDVQSDNLSSDEQSDNLIGDEQSHHVEIDSVD